MSSVKWQLSTHVSCACEQTSSAAPYVSGELNPGKTTAFEQHFVDCDVCVRRIEIHCLAIAILSRARRLRPEVAKKASSNSNGR
jgi:hypothetical protein